MCVKFVGLHVYFGRDASLFFPYHPDYSIRMGAFYIPISIIVHVLVEIGFVLNSSQCWNVSFIFQKHAVKRISVCSMLVGCFFRLLFTWCANHPCSHQHCFRWMATSHLCQFVPSTLWPGDSVLGLPCHYQHWRSIYTTNSQQIVIGKT